MSDPITIWVRENHYQNKNGKSYHFLFTNDETKQRFVCEYEDKIIEILLKFGRDCRWIPGANSYRVDRELYERILSIYRDSIVGVEEEIFSK